MDRVEKHITSKQRAHVSELISIRDFQAQWESVLRSFYDIKSTNKVDVEETIMHSMNVKDEKLLDSLRYDCRPKSLDCDLGDMTPITQFISTFDMEKHRIRNKEINLTTTKLQEQDLLKRVKNRNHHLLSVKYWKENYFDTIALPSKIEETKDVQDSEVVLEIEVYRPAKYENEFCRDRDTHSCYRNVVSFISDQYNVLGSQKLSDLKDTINCFSDLVGVRDQSNLNQKPGAKAKDVYKSGFIYINGVFYNDFRDPDNKDYSQVITEWAKVRTPNMGPYKTEIMEETTFLDLSIRLSYPYMYQHQGDCEHILIFNNIRMINKEDSQMMKDYPMPIQYPRRYSNQCMLCSTKVSKWVTTDSKRVYEDPFFYCEDCFKAYNYTKDGEKIGDFKAYYIHL